MCASARTTIDSPYNGESGAEDDGEHGFSGKLTYNDKGFVEIWEKEKGKRIPWQRFRGKVLAANPFLKRFV